jgi:Lrp/AsnC family transcriptional regulator, leucine-responsive regulatory protein
MTLNQRRVTQNADVSLDDTNRRLLVELQQDARLSLAELGRRVGLSSPAVTERLQRLEQSGTIVGYRAEIDPRALGLPLTCVIRIRPGSGQIQKVANVARATPEIVECNRITGEDCYLTKAHLRDVQHLEEVIDRFTPFGQTTTSIVQSSPVPARPIALAGPGESPSSAAERGRLSKMRGSRGRSAAASRRHTA